MARTGRPPKPIEVHRRNGNPSNKKLPAPTETLALVPVDGIPAPITLEAHGRELWRRAQDRAAWLSELDLVALQDLCETWDEVCAMRAAIAEEGLTSEEPIVTPAGHVVGQKKVPHPLIKELRSAQKQLHAIGSALGFDPTARSRLGLAEVKRQSKLEELAASRQAQ